MCLAGAVAGFTERFVTRDGVRLRVVEAGRRGDPPVVLAHGFPDLALGWRHQIAALAAAGYHVLAPDQRGYGGSSCPAEVSAYDIHALTADLVGLVDELTDAERAVFVGHDWGATVVWSLTLLYPDRVAGTVGLSVPPVPRALVAPTEAFAKFGPDFYILHFQRPGVADAELAADPAATVAMMFGGRPGWLEPEVFDEYVREFTRTGYTGGLNWYRNFDRNWATTPELAGATFDTPGLFIVGGADPTARFLRTDRARQVAVGRYGELVIDDAGHWLAQERPAEVTAVLLDFLSWPQLRDRVKR